MLRARRWPWLLGAACLGVLAAPQVVAEEAAGQALVPQPLTVADAMAWRDSRAERLSNDGKWFAHTFDPNYGDGEVVIRATDSETAYRHALGGAVAFSSDSQWAAFLEGPSLAERARLEQQRRQPTNKLILLRLSDGEKKVFESARRFAFSGRSAQWLALQRSAPEGQQRQHRGTDLLLRELATGREMNIGNVADFAFSETGAHLAYVIDAEAKTGNGVYALRLRDLRTFMLDTSSDATYTRLNWTDIDENEGLPREALVALRARESKAHEEPLHTLVAARAFDTDAPQVVVYDPAQDETFPDGLTISPNRTPEWRHDRRAVTFGIHDARPKAGDAGKQEDGEAGTPDSGEAGRPGVGDGAAPGGPRRGPAPAAEPKDDKLPSLILWHWKDKRLQPQQRLQQQTDRNFSYLAIWHLDQRRFVRLADEEVRSVTLDPRHRWAVGRDDREHERRANLVGVRLVDVYAIDPVTGARRPLLTAERWAYGASPTGEHLLFYRDRHFHSVELATGSIRNLTQSIPANFWNEEADVNVEDPPDSPAGWTPDGRSALLSDGWDIWAVPLAGGPPQNLTGDGARERIRYRRFSIYLDERGVDLTKPQYFRIYGDRTKQAGFARRLPNGRIERLVWEDASFGFSAQKARAADRFLYGRSTAATPREVYIADLAFRTPRQLTDVAAQMAPFVWSPGSRLIEYTNARGEPMQAALFLPADYEEGRRYPCIVYIYERMSQNLNSFQAPRYGGFSGALYNSNGYAALMPDITYRVNDPGLSAVECVLPAVAAAVASGVVDPARVGLHGHSWGGYQTAFLVSQTDAFRAAVAGAPLTNMASMYGLVYKNTGSSNAAIFEASQGRFAGGPWELLDAYVRNSPVMHADRVTTPLMILHNDLDGAVDFTQGVEYFTALRRLDKEVVLLEYEGENHGLGRPENREDYSIRMFEFFEHHLKGAEAPLWYAEGIEMLKMKEHLDERAVAEAKAKDEANQRAQATRKPKPTATDLAQKEDE